MEPFKLSYLQVIDENAELRKEIINLHNQFVEYKKKFRILGGDSMRGIIYRYCPTCGAYIKENEMECPNSCIRKTKAYLCSTLPPDHESIREMQNDMRITTVATPTPQFKAYERSKMSKTLRYKILERDKFECQICGRTAKDGVKLHIDHIIPISKGGKTIESNLRTLCEDCNLGKSDN